MDIIFGGCLFRAHDGTADEGLACAGRKLLRQFEPDRNNLRIFSAAIQRGVRHPALTLACRKIMRYDNKLPGRQIVCPFADT